MEKTGKVLYEPNADRYGKMKYPYCGKSGLRLPVISPSDFGKTLAREMI